LGTRHIRSGPVVKDGHSAVTFVGDELDLVHAVTDARLPISQSARALVSRRRTV
jgi:hypothetical protein